MASANLELVRSIVTAWERGDFSSAEWAHPEIEYVMVGGPAPGRWTGLAGMAEGTRQWLDAWEELSLETEEYRELDGGRVLILSQFSARGRASGLEIGQIRSEGAALFHVEGGQVTKLVFYMERPHALEQLAL